MKKLESDFARNTLVVIAGLSGLVTILDRGPSVVAGIIPWDVFKFICWVTAFLSIALLFLPGFQKPSKEENEERKAVDARRIELIAGARKMVSEVLWMHGTKPRQESDDRRGFEIRPEFQALRPHLSADLPPGSVAEKCKWLSQEIDRIERGWKLI